MNNPKYKRCSRCILSSKFPKINYDDKGVCNFCRDEMFFSIENKHIEKARNEILNLFETQAGSSEYDAIFCFSGGKDSTYALNLAVNKYKLNVLAFTLDNGFLSSFAFKNIKTIVDYLGVDHVTFKPSFKFMKSLFKVSSLHNIFNPKTLTRISANCNSCISMINMYALKTALEKRAPFIIAGFTLGQIPSNAILFRNNYNFLRESREAVLTKLRDDLGNVVDRYFCISSDLITTSTNYPYNINLLCLEDCTEDDIFANIKTIGWRPPDDVDGCSSNCRLNTFNNYIHKEKFGYNPYELELSRLIRKGQLSRNDALDKINDQPLQYLETIMSDLDISKSDISNLER